MRLVSIAVVAANRVIGDGNDQPFKFAEDWRRFKSVTMGHPLIMGRKTHEAMGLLPGRFSIIVSRNPAAVAIETDADGKPRGVAVSSLDEAIQLAEQRDPELAFVIGGGQIYAATMDIVDELDLTEVHAAAAGTVLFPEIDPEIWAEVSREPREEFDFVSYQRR